MFSEFMSKMEKAKKMKEEFGDFMQWKKEKMMDEKKDAEKEMPTFTYFDVRARGEISRLIIEYGDLPIKEIRVTQEQNVTQQAILRAGLPAAYDLYFSNFKQYLEANPAGRNGLVLGDKLSLADLIIFEGSQTAFQTMPEILEKFPAIKALRAKVMATEGLMHYLVKRPKFDL